MNLKDLNLVIVDIETTGARIVQNRIIEIGIIRVQKGRVVQRYSKLINPQQPIPTSITKLTGIHETDVWDAPSFQEVHEEIFNILQDAIFVAHNVRFDYGFLKQEFKRLGVDFKAKCLCSVCLLRILYKQEK
ncbi:MAG: 3'-5' exonuclease, partial [Candidatus Omnitrophica bacterium]|nr:3'-5' exonuclease [Candidatus Omnitrophota bacterium]